MHICFSCFSLVYLPRMLVIRSVAAHGWLSACGPWTAAHSLASVGSVVYNCLVLLPNYLSECKVLQLLRYNTTLNAFGKSEFPLVGYSYSIKRTQQAKLKCMLGVVRPRQWRRVGGQGCICSWAPAEGGAERVCGNFFATRNIQKLR